MPMSSKPTLPTPQCVPLTPERLPAYLEFFDRRAFADNPKWAGCYCYFPLHDPARTNWPQRTSDENRWAVTACVHGGTARGILAYVDGRVVGWCNAGPWSQFPMLRNFPQREAESLGAILCFVVDPRFRGQGIARSLLDAACDELRAAGLKAVQAKPARRAEGAAANHFGPLSMYLAAGFSVVADMPNGDVIVRKELAATQDSHTATLFIPASPATAYEAFVQPDRLVQWLPPEGSRGHIEVFEPHAGGRLRMTLAFDAVQGKSAGNVDVVEARFVELLAPRRIVLAVEFPSPDPSFSGVMKMTWSFDPEGTGTRVTIVAEDVPRGITRAEHEAGLNSTLANLRGFVSRS
jgi:uncharacterized protein YndB with AHSA1/START domain/ribosomal protein S18 acetylase RimI-like enzyme